MPTDWELWAVANQTLDQHGSDAPLVVAERIGALALKGDMKGIEVWKQIARRMIELDSELARGSGSSEALKGALDS